MTASQTVSYRVDQETVVRFEVDPGRGFSEAAASGKIVADVQNAIGPAVEAARVVLDRIRPLGSDGVEVRFGVKVSGSEDWLIARVADEGTFEITLSWRPKA